MTASQGQNRVPRLGRRGEGATPRDPWASAEPQASYDALREDFAAHGPAAVEPFPFAPLTEASRSELLEKLARAAGVFFEGGEPPGRRIDLVPRRP